MKGQRLRRLVLGGLMGGAVTMGATSAGAVALDEAAHDYLGCLHLHTVAAMSAVSAPLTRAGVEGAVDAAMARCEARFAVYTEALVAETLRRNSWRKANSRGVSEFKAAAPAAIRQRLIDAYAKGL